jgi:leucyl-tRNA synthetase
VEESLEVPVQINGKVRDRLTIPARDPGEKEVLKLALARDRVKENLAGKEIVKTIYVPGKLLSLVVK